MKRLVWLIGKPGSGKTTVGELISQEQDIVHFSYGQLLKQVQPNPGMDGYSLEDREKVNQILIEASRANEIVFVDGNPYSQLGFGFLKQIEKDFDEIITIELLIDDTEALARLNERNREVVAHDGNSQQERLDAFNNKLKPLIDRNRDLHGIKNIDVNSLTPDEVSKEIKEII